MGRQRSGQGPAASPRYVKPACDIAGVHRGNRRHLQPDGGRTRSIRQLRPALSRAPTNVGTRSPPCRDAPRALQFLDLSGIAPVLKDTVAIERLLQLKEVLDRIDIPAFADIPDAAAMAQLPSKRWRLPNTEIDIVLEDKGDRAGEYLVSAATIERLPEFYERVKDLPYKPGPGQRLADVYSSISHGGATRSMQGVRDVPIRAICN